MGKEFVSITDPLLESTGLLSKLHARPASLIRGKRAAVNGQAMRRMQQSKLRTDTGAS